jgi:hypothetical protein
MIVEGKIDEAMNLINKYFPKVFEDGNIRLSILCLKFVEMAANCIHSKDCIHVV